MEPNEIEKHLLNLKEHIAEFLDNISEIGSAINKKSKTLLCQIGNISHEDIDGLEKIGLGMIKMLKTLNVNVIDIINLLENDVKEVTGNHNKELFKDLCSKILEYKKSILTDTTSNSVILKLNKFLDKDTQTECNNDIPNVNGIQPRPENFEDKSEKESSSVVNISEEVDDTTTKDSKITNSINLALVRTDTQDTEDCWIDSINRNTTALELWNREYKGEKNYITDEFLKQLKEEQNEDSEWDRKTEDMNYNFDRQLSPKDDTFIDGKSPKAEKTDDEMASTEVNVSPRSGSEDNKSLEIEEHKISSIDEATSPRKNSEETLSGSEGLHNELNKESLSDVTNALNTFKERPVSKETEELITGNSQDGSCFSTTLKETKVAQTYSEQIVPSTSKTNNENDLDKYRDTNKNIGCTERKKSESDSLSSLDESMSTALITLAERLEIESSGSKASEIIISSESDDGQQLSNENLDKIEGNELNVDNIEKNESSVVEQNLESLNLCKDGHKEDNGDQVPSEITYSQETVNLNMALEQLSGTSSMPDNDEIDVNKDADELSEFEQLTQILNHPKNTDEPKNESSKRNYTPYSDEIETNKDKLSVSEQLSQTVDHLESIDETEPLSSTRCREAENDETDIDEDANNLAISEPPQQISDHPKDHDDLKHLPSERSKTADSDETDIDEDANKSPISEQHPQVIGHSKNTDEIEHLPSEKTIIRESDEKGVDEDPSKNIAEEEHPSSKNNKITDSDEICDLSEKSHTSGGHKTNTDEVENSSDCGENILTQSDINNRENLNEYKNKSGCNKTGVDEEANKVLMFFNNINSAKHLSEHDDKSDSNETDFEEDTNKLSIFEKSKEIFDNSKEENLSVSTKTIDINKTKKLSENNSGKVVEEKVKQSSDEADAIEDELPTPSQTTDSQGTTQNIDKSIDRIIAEINMPDSEEPDNKDCDNTNMSESPSQSLDNTENNNILPKPTNDLESTSSQRCGEENLPETNKDEADESEESVNGKNNPDSVLSTTNNDITEINESPKKLSNIEEDSSSQDSNKASAFNSSKNNNIELCATTEDGTKNDYVNSTKTLEDIQEDSSSQNSSKSFVFGISENFNSIVDVTQNNSVNPTKNLPATEDGNSSHSSNKSLVFDISENHFSTGQVDGENEETNTLDKIETKQKDKPTDNVEETIEILSDSDDEVHLDVTMEEIISSEIVGSTDQKRDVKKEEETEDLSDSPEPVDVKEKGDYNKCSSQQIIGDELLELLREVEVPSIPPLNDYNRSTQKSDNKKEIKEADEIFKMLQEENMSDLSDSDSDVSSDISLSSDTELENICKDIRAVDTKKQESLIDDIKNVSSFDIKECYVCFKRLQLDVGDVVKVNKNLSDSIDRLCDISNILGKRKLGGEQTKSNSKKIKKSLASKKGTSDSESISDYSDCDSDNSLRDIPTCSTNFNVSLDQKLDDLLANEICKVWKDDSSSESTDVDSDHSNNTPKNIKKGEKWKTDVRKKHILSREERIKKSWKNDPLLREKLISDESSSSSTSDTENSSRKRKPLKCKYEHDTDFNVTSDENDSESDNSHTSKLNKTRLEAKTISPIKRNIPISDSSTDTDSDVEIIVPKQITPQKESDAVEQELAANSSQKGRRNIRALMSDESLAEATQRANKDEQERIERLEGRNKIKESLSQSFSQIVEEDTLVLDMNEVTGEPLVKVHPKLNRRLKPHQKSGIQFMWDSCYESLERLKEDEGSGCILAHCMGLGKTFQVIALLHTLFSYEETNTKHVLVVCPTSTVNNWKKEVKIAFKHFPTDKLNIITIVNKKEMCQKYDIVKKWYLYKNGVLVLGYECFETLTNESKLEKIDSSLKEKILKALIDPGPNLVVCDEGHLLKNKKALKTLALNKIRTKRRIVLTGTPLQNNLLEYYYMVNFVKPNLLGNIKEYKTNFVNPITNGQYEDSTAEDIKLMMKRTHVLHKLLKKTIQRVEDSELKKYLPKIVDHAVFIQLHQVQVDLYNKFSQLVEINSVNTNRKGFLSDFAIFQYIGTHPHLLAIMENLRNKKIKERDLITDEQEDNPICNIEGWWKVVVPPDCAEKIQYGNKLMVLKSIIEECEEIDDKVLVFSQSLGELNLIEHFLEKEGTSKCPSWKKKIDYCRMDGTVPPSLRSTICDLFNNKDNKKLRLLLMSTKVGGLGLNLTAANRVIITTVNWNPSYDIQSVFRVYRFGQEKPVYVYRLIALDSMEEKVYQRTVTKLAIAHRVVDKHQITRHYKSVDLQELYSCRPNADSERPICNVPEDKVLAKLILKLPFIFKQHEHQALLENRPEDNLNEHELNAAWDEFKRIKDAPPPPVHLPQPPPQISLPNGPTYSMAYDLTRPTTSGNTTQRIGGTTENSSLVHYYIPSEANNEAMKTNRPTNFKARKQIPKVILESIMAESRRDPRMVPVQNPTKSTKEQDPLYIPSEPNKTSKNYREMLLDLLKEKESPAPKLPPDTTIVLDESSEKSNQKENLHHRNPMETSRGGSVVVLDESNKMTNNSLLKNNGGPLYNSTGGKRKRIIDSERQGLIKKMRDGFNNFPSYPTSITVDDDDDITEIPDTASESGSLSNELIKNLVKSGTSIRKVMKDGNRNCDVVITLD